MIDRARNITLVLLGILVGVGAAFFVVENQQPITVELLWAGGLSVVTPLWAIAAVAFVAGMMLTALVALRGSWARRKTTQALKRQIRDMGAELTHLRNLPLENLPPLDEADPKPRRRRDAPRDLGLSQAELLPPSREGRGGDPYEAFLDDGEGFDDVEAETYLQDRDEAEEAGDPYAALFDRVDPVVREMDEAELYPAVVDRSRNREGRG